MNDAPERAIVIGASAGAIEALSVILPALPADFPAPILIVVHIPSDRSNFLSPLFAAKCQMSVREVEDKEPAERGIVYFAPSNYHLLVEEGGTLALSADEPVQHSRPSIDVLFESAAEAYGAGLVGIVLTGANEDGSSGAQAIATAHGTVIVEDPAGAYAETMPRAAIRKCPEAHVMALDAIAPFLLRELGRS